MPNTHIPLFRGSDSFHMLQGAVWDWVHWGGGGGACQRKRDRVPTARNRPERVKEDKSSARKNSLASNSRKSRILLLPEVCTFVCEITVSKSFHIIVPYVLKDFVGLVPMQAVLFFFYNHLADQSQMHLPDTPPDYPQGRTPPLDLSFWSFLTFFAPWYRKSREGSSVKIA